jgi:hypothetical protein
VWAFTTIDTDHEAFSVDTPAAPAGFVKVDGDTAIGTDWYGGGTTILYADGMIAHREDFPYVDPDTGVPGIARGPFTALETAIVTFAHEVRHQYGKDDEDMADGYGYKVLLKYRSGSKCK